VSSFQRRFEPQS